MLEPAILGLLGIMIGVGVPMSFKWERRLTRVETKMDSLLKKNGIEPSSLFNPQKK